MPDAVPVGKAFIDVMPNLTGFGAAGATAGTQASKGFGSTFASGMKKVGKAALAGFAAITAGAGLAGAGLVKLGGNFDEAYDTIQTGTGATGNKLAGLNKSFRNVFSSIPTSMGPASSAITDLNTLTGATGTTLEGLSTQVLEASRLLGEDGASNAKLFGQALQQWGVSAKEGTNQLDGLFKITQDYGVGLGPVISQLSEYGSVLQNAGFTMEESAVIFGQLEKSGLSVSRVMPGLNMAFRNWASEGKNSRKEMSRTVDEIKNAESAQKALAIATEQFGAEGAQRLTTAIRSGNLELGNLQKALKGADGSIADTASETDSWSEKLRTLGNKVLVGLEPLASKVFDGFGTAIEKATPHIESFATWLGDNVPKAMTAVGDAIAWVKDNVIPPLIDAFKTAVDWVRSNWPQIRDTVTNAAQRITDALSTLGNAFRTAFQWVIDNKPAIGAIASVIGTLLVNAIIKWTAKTWLQVKALWAQAAAFAAAHAPLVAIAAAIAALVAGVIYAYQNWEWFRQAVDAVARWLRDELLPAVKAMAIWLRDRLVPAAKAVARWFMQNVVPALKAVVRWMRDNLIPAVQAVVRWFRDSFVPAVRKAWKKASEIVSTAIRVIRDVVQKVTDVISGIWDKFGNHIVDFLRDRWNTIKSLVRAAINVVKGIINTVTALIRGDWGEAWEGIKQIFSGVWDAIKALVRDAIERVKSILSLAWTAIKEGAGLAWDGIKSAASDAWASIKETVSQGVDAVVQWITDLPGQLLEAAGDLVRAGKDLAASLLGGLADGLAGVWDTVTSPFRDAINTVIGWFNSLSVPQFTFGGQSLPGPLPDIPGFTVGGWDLFNMPYLHTGGIVPGNGDVPIMAKGGEGVFTREQMSAIGAGLGTAGVPEVRFVIEGGDDDLAHLLRKWIRYNGRGNVQVALGQS